MIKLIICAPRKAGMTPEEWHAYSRNHHKPLYFTTAVCQRYVRKYVQNHALPEQDAWGTSPYDAVVELTFNSLDAADAFLTDPEYLSIIRPDEERFNDFSKIVFLAASEELVFDKTTTSDATELIQRWYDGIAKGDMSADGLRELTDPQVEWHDLEGFPAGGVLIGQGAVFDEYTPKMMAYFDRIQAFPDELLPSGADVVVALGHYRGRTKASGVDFEVPFAHVWRIRDNKIWRLEQYTDTLKFAAALTGVEMQPGIVPR